MNEKELGVVKEGWDVVWWEPSLTDQEARLIKRGLVFNRAASERLPERVSIGVDSKKGAILIIPHDGGIALTQYGKTGKGILRVGLVRWLECWGFGKGKYLVSESDGTLVLTSKEVEQV